MRRFGLFVLASLCAGLGSALPACTPLPARPTQAAPPVSAPIASAAEATALLERRELFPGWDQLPLADFERRLAEKLPAGPPFTFAPSAFEELASALRGGGELGLRAVLLLARTSDPLASALLLGRLERRLPVVAQDALGNAVDLTAAAALALVPPAPEVGAHLESLSFGKRPHPDLEVRVECGASALRLGRDKPVEFLLSVLKAGTQLEIASALWKPAQDMEFCQRRAAEALCERASRPCQLHALSPLAEREEEIRALEAALRPVRLTRP